MPWSPDGVANVVARLQECGSIRARWVTTPAKRTARRTEVRTMPSPSPATRTIISCSNAGAARTARIFGSSAALGLTNEQVYAETADSADYPVKAHPDPACVSRARAEGPSSERATPFETSAPAAVPRPPCTISIPPEAIAEIHAELMSISLSSDEPGYPDLHKTRSRF